MSKDHPAPPQPLAHNTAERLAAIVEAAEQAAVTVIDDAEKQARQHLEQAQTEADRIVADRLASLADLSDSLVAQAEAIRSQAEQLLAALGESQRQIAVEGGADAAADHTAARSVRAPHLSAVAPVEEPTPAEQDRPGPSRAAEPGTAAGARLLATQMAVSGSSREEIEGRLRNGFEIEDTASILDAILGPEE